MLLLILLLTREIIYLKDLEESVDYENFFPNLLRVIKREKDFSNDGEVAYKFYHCKNVIQIDVKSIV